MLGIMLAVLAIVFMFGASLQSENVHDHIEAYGVILIVTGNRRAPLVNTLHRRPEGIGSRQ